jgi:hypothetical protein
MSEPFDVDGSADEFVESRLRSLTATPARLDRDRLMHLAGQRSVLLEGRSRTFWPAMTIVSWIACSIVAAYSVMRPARVVVQERVVERIIEVPSVDLPSPKKEALAIAESAPQTIPVASPNTNEFGFLDDLRRPLSALASRPALFEKLSEDTLASANTEADEAASLSLPKSQIDLRREMLGQDPTSQLDRLWWF